MLTRKPVLTAQELAIMKVIWRSGTSTVRDVYEALLADRKIAYTTVMTMMNILEQKGYLKKSQKDRAFTYQATKPQSDDERTEYLEDDRLDLSAWARDAIALALPDQILCRSDCAGLCPVCGKDLNVEPHEHVEERLDPRWEKLSQLRQE